MENLLPDNLYSDQEFSQLIHKYNYLYNVFRSKFSDDLINKFGLDKQDKIIDVQRWLVCGSNQIFWDYLWATHSVVWNKISSIKDLKNKWTVCRCIKFIFWDKKSLIISTNSSPSQTPEWILCLDEYYLKLSGFERKYFDNILLWINKFEYEHFNSQSYIEILNQLKEATEDELFQVLKITKN